MSDKTVDVHFELYTLRDGRWVLDACFADEDEAREQAARVARRAAVRGVRLRREVNLPGMAEPIVTTLVDTTVTERPFEFRLKEAPRLPTAMLPHPSLRGDTRQPHSPRDATPPATPVRERSALPWRMLVLATSCALIAAAVVALGVVF